MSGHQREPEDSRAEEDRTTIRPGPPRREEISPAHRSRGSSRLTDESLWQRSAAPIPDHRARVPRSGQPSAHPKARSQTKPARRTPAHSRVGLIQLLVLVLVASVVGLISTSMKPPPEVPNMGRVAPRKSAAQFAKPVEKAALPASSGVLRRDVARDEVERPFGYRDRAHYQSGTDPVGALYAATLDSPVSSLNELDAHSGWANRNRFGAVSCGRVDTRVECGMLLRGGLLVVVAADTGADMGRVAEATSDLYRDLG